MWEMETELVLRLMISAALGALVGLERELTHRPAGLRTHMLVSIGACLFTIVIFSSVESNQGPALAGILTGIGFIGAGSIIATHAHVQGITTAASLWVVAAIGFTTGTGNYILALMAAILVFIVLQLRRVEKVLKK